MNHMNTPDVKRKLAAILSADVEGYSRLKSDVKVLMKHKLNLELKGGQSCV
jgi:hypothetical protein